MNAVQEFIHFLYSKHNATNFKSKNGYTGKFFHTEKLTLLKSTIA